MNCLEIFSGAGGLAKGLENAGFTHTAFVERNKYACESLRENFNPNSLFCGDIQGFDFSNLHNVDLVAGGPPCQPFSLGGRHKAERDSRDMFPHAIRSIRELSPNVFIFENVKGLLRTSFSDYFDYITLRLAYPNHYKQTRDNWREHLRKLMLVQKSSHCYLSYTVKHKLINAANYGVPQLRQRVFIAGVRSDLDVEWTYPSETHSEDRLLWDMFVTGEYWDRHHVSPSERPPLVGSLERKISQLKNRYGMFEPELKPWRTIRDAISDIPSANSRHGIDDHKLRDGARTYPGHTGSYYDWPAKTVKAGGHGVPGGENMIRYPDGQVRYFTVYEAKRIQTFPDDFVIAGPWGEAMRQIGNAVPVLLAEAIGRTAAQKIRRASLAPSLKMAQPPRFHAQPIFRGALQTKG